MVNSLDIRNYLRLQSINDADFPVSLPNYPYTGGLKETISFFWKATDLKRYLDEDKHTLVIAPFELKDETTQYPQMFLFSEYPKMDYANAVRKFFKPERLALIHPSVIKDGAVTLGSDVSIGAHSVLEGIIQIGDNTSIGSNVHIQGNVTIGSHCRIDSFSIIGGDGLDIAVYKDTLEEIPHLGGLIIGDYVVVGGSSTIRQSIKLNDSTVIEDCVMIGNGVHIGHCGHIGKRVFIADGVCVSGSVKIGDNARIAPNATISNGLEIADGADISIGAVVVTNVSKGKKFSGNFAIDHDKFKVEMLRRLRLKSL